MSAQFAFRADSITASVPAGGSAVVATTLALAAPPATACVLKSSRVALRLTSFATNAPLLNLSLTQASDVLTIQQDWASAGMGIGAVALLGLGGAGALPMHATFGSVVFAGHPVSWLVPVLGLSLVAGVLAYVAAIYGTRLLGPRLASFTGLTEVLFAVLVSAVGRFADQFDDQLIAEFYAPRDQAAASS